jgi:hypothetical protein
MAQNITTCTGAVTVSGQLAVGATTVQLTTTIKTCLRVKIMAPRLSHPIGALNTNDILVVIAATTPADGKGGEAIAVDGSRDNYFHVDDPRNIWLIGSHANDVIEYRIESV